MTQFYFVRHGPTHAKTLVGWSDLPADLSDRAALARLEATLPRDAVVVSSDLHRAIATADAIQNGRPRLPHDPALREIHFGAWELQHWQDIPDQDHLRAFWDNPGDIAPPGGESWNVVSARVSGAADRLAATYPGQPVVVVAHFGAILTQVQRATGAVGRAAFAHKIDNLSLTELHLTPQGWAALRINHAC